MAEIHCTNCGAELGEETRFCPSCGRPVHETAAVPTPEADVGIPPPPSQQPTAQQGQGYGGAGSTYGAPAPPRRRRTWLWVLIGAGGCLIVILVAVLGFAGCTAALIGGAASGGGEQQSPKEKYYDAKDKAVPVGETVKAGNVAWTVRSVQQSTELKAFGSRKKGNFVIVDVLFKNNGNEAVTLDSSSLIILDDKGRENETDPDASMYVPSNQDLFLNQVNPGVTKSGRAIFNVAPDAEGLILRVGDTNPFGGTNAYVDLGV